MRLDKPKVWAGDTVRLQELIPKSTGLEFSGVRHAAVRVGTVDQTGRVTNLAPGEFGPVAFGIDKHFEGLSFAHAFYHGLVYTVEEPDREGIEFAFKLKEPGVYLLTADWTLRGERTALTGPLVVLTVRPKK